MSNSLAGDFDFAEEMIDDFGGDAVYNEVIKGSFDGVTYVDDVVNPNDVVVLRSKLKSGDLKDDTISVSDAVFLISSKSLDFKPTAIDEVIFNGETYSVKVVIPITNGNTVEVYRLICSIS